MALVSSVFSDNLIAYEGVTTADGGAGGITLIDTVLLTKPEYNGNLVVINSGTYKGQAADINGTTLAGTVTPHTAFGGIILTGTSFTIYGIRTVPAEVAAVITAIAALGINIDNIFDLVNAILTTTETGGTVSTNGAAEVDVYINDAPAGVYKPIILKIWFTNQTAAETVVIREKYRIEAVGGFIENDEVLFAGVQDPLLRNIRLDPTRFGVQVTIAKTAGADRAYRWEVVYDI